MTHLVVSICIHGLNTLYVCVKTLHVRRKNDERMCLSITRSRRGGGGSDGAVITLLLHEIRVAERVADTQTTQLDEVPRVRRKGRAL